MLTPMRSPSWKNCQSELGYYLSKRTTYRRGAVVLAAGNVLLALLVDNVADTNEDCSVISS